jgi:mono/diheme cytochrome c family protein
MKHHLLIPALFFFVSPMLLSAGPTETIGHWKESVPVYQVLKELGDPMPAHYLPQRDEQLVKQGEEIVKYGVTRGPDGTKTTVQSKYFACTDCHNLRREDPNLKRSDPNIRLDYAIQNRLRFLPGTTFYGVVNRTTWYNGDYLKKYKDSAAKANKDLVNAIQLCATQCAMGRKLDDWELQSVLGYFWSLELTLEDLNLSESDWKKLKLAPLRNDNNQGLISWLKGFYLNASPATFSKPPTPITAPDTYAPNIKNGKAIYVLSCLNCHKSGGATSFPLANSAVTYRLLNDHTDFGANFSIYNAIRNGIKASPGKGYMPNFPLQRMSNNQMKDLRAFIKYQARHEPLALEPLIDWINE